MQENLSLPESLAPIVHMTEQAVGTGCLGAIAARAGVGKTSFLVQVALHAMFSGQNVLHINLNDPLGKTVLWYKEVFFRLTDKHPGLGETVNLDMILGRRFIMTMKVGEFSVAAIQERLSDLIEQEIFAPQLLLVDGLNFDESQDETVLGLKELTRAFSLRTWVAMSVHREEERDENGLPIRLSDLDDRIDLIWELLPESGKINVNLLKGQSAPGCFLDPLSLLLQR